MPAFQVVPHAQFSPTSCVTCGTSSDEVGFVDLLVDTAVNGFGETDGFPLDDPAVVKPTIGHLYLCCTCLYQAAVAAGCLDPAQKAEAEDRLAEANDRIADLSQELEVSESQRFVPLADLQKLLGEKAPVKAAA